MLIHPWDQADEATWRPWLAARDFGTLAANGPDGAPPVLVPTHFFYDQGPSDHGPSGHGSSDGGSSDHGDEVILHLARPNPFWAAVAANPRLTLAVTDDYAFAPSTWRATAVPTSYYASVQFDCTAEVVESAAGKAEIAWRA